MATSLQSLHWTDGQDNPGGVKTVLYFIHLSEVINFPLINPNPTTFEDLVNLVGNFELAPGKAWYKIYGTLEKGGITSSLVGERDGKSFENRCKFFHPGSQAEIFGFAEHLKNTDLVILMKELDDQVRVFGTKYIPAKVDVAESNTGEAVADLKGIEITIKSIGRMAPVYYGVIQTVPGENSSYPYTYPFPLS